MTTNNYILCRWRDASTDPPEHGGLYRITLPSGRSDAYARFAKMHGWLTIDTCEFLRVVQWLDITAIPGVPREAVQAAVDEMDTLRQHHGHQTSTCDYTETDHEQGMEDGLGEAEDIILRHTGVDAARAAFEGRK